MGNVLCWCKKKNRKKIVLLLVGLDNAGKTVAAKGLAGESTESVVPTVGFSVVNLNYQNCIVKLFDLGGGANIRGIWHKYFVDAHGVIFVVDSSDISRLDEARDVLRELLSHEKVSGKPVLILANKQDNENALDEVDIIEKLDLESIVNGNKCPTLVECCAAREPSENSKIDTGIKKGYDWLLHYIVRNYEYLNERVQRDVIHQISLENQLRMEKIEKIRALKELEHKNQQDEDAIESYSNYERKMNGQTLESESLINVDNETECDSDDSSESFPPVYHVKEDIRLERPKSAVQIVRQQLEWNAPRKKTTFVSRASNKTAPLHLYGMEVPRSASLYSRNYHRPNRRFLKSAGDVPSKVTQLPNVAVGDDFHREIVDLLNIDSKKLPHVNFYQNKTEKGVPLVHKRLNGVKNGISIVDIDL